jgi:hypothetical protein
MLHKCISRFAVFSIFSMVTLASVLAHAHDGNNGWVTLNVPYSLWTNTYGDNTIRIMLKTVDYYNPSACPAGNVDSYMVSTGIPAEARQRIYSTLLAAKLAGKPVKLFLDTNSCEQGKPKILHVTID